MALVVTQKLASSIRDEGDKYRLLRRHFIYDARELQMTATHEFGEN